MCTIGLTIKPYNKLSALFIVLYVDLRAACVEGICLGCLCHSNPPESLPRLPFYFTNNANQKWLHEMMSVKAKHFIQRNQL